MTSKARTSSPRSRSRLIGPRLVALICTMVLAPLLPEPPPAAAAIIDYVRKQRDFPLKQGGTTPMYTWGFLDDECLKFPSTSCMSMSSPLRMRPEASAQSLAIYALVAKLNDNPVPWVRLGCNMLDWEVGRRPIPRR